MTKIKAYPKLSKILRMALDDVKYMVFEKGYKLDFRNFVTTDSVCPAGAVMVRRLGFDGVCFDDLNEQNYDQHTKSVLMAMYFLACRGIVEAVYEAKRVLDFDLTKDQWNIIMDIQRRYPIISYNVGDTFYLNTYYGIADELESVGL